MNSENTLKEKVRKVFKGLTEQHYDILKFFHEKEGTSKYDASKYFEGKEPQKPQKKIPRATLYRKIKNLQDTEFLKVVGYGPEFKRGPLTAKVELLSTRTFKGTIALLGSNINPEKVLGETPEGLNEFAFIPILNSFEKRFEFLDNLFDAAIEDGRDLTDKASSEIAPALVLSMLYTKMDYASSLIDESTLQENKKKAIREFTKLARVVRKELFPKKKKSVEP